MLFLQKLLLGIVIVVGRWSSEHSGQVNTSADSNHSTGLAPSSRNELDRREAHRLYGIALLDEHANRLENAVRALERAGQRQPEAPEVRKALIPLYLALDRADDALAACQKVLDLDAADYETWCLYARQLKAQGQAEEALHALERAFRCPELSKDAE